MTDAEGVLEGLDDEQRVAAATLTGPLCILAGAGTGKTRAITHRIAYGVRTGTYDPHRVLAVTFTARAAAEMRSRLTGLGAPGVQARTFHAAALRQLQYFWPVAVGGPLPQILDYKVRLLAEAAKRLRMTTDRASLRDFASEIEWSKVSTLTPEGYLAQAADRPEPGGIDQQSFAKLYQAYEDIKADRQLMDFEDVLLFTAGMLENDERVAAQVRRQYRHFVVDEYQDVSPLQQRLLDLWLGGREELCVVGDAAQTIYSFTGATPDYLMSFRRRYPEAEMVKLVRDYRSTPQVVSLANDLLADRRSSSQASWPEPLQLISQRNAGPTPMLTEHTDDDAEAAWVAEQIVQLREAGTPLSEVAVLYRTNGQSQTFEQALASAGVSYQLRGSERFFSRPEVREALAALRTSSVTVEQAPEEVGQQVRAVLSSLGWKAQAPTSAGAVRERWESLAALVSLADQLAAERQGMTLRDFIAELDERSATRHRPHRRRGHAGVAALRQGAGVGCGVPRRAERRADADLLRRLPAEDRRGAPPALRRHHQGAHPSVAQLRSRPARWGKGAAPTLPLPHAAAPHTRTGAGSPPHRPRCWTTQPQCRLTTA